MIRVKRENMSLIVDNYRINWALRYIREAEADLSSAKGSPMPAVGVSLALLAMRKSQTAIYYSLGDPAYLAPLITQRVANEGKTKDILMCILVQMEQLIQRDSKLAETLSKNAAIADAGHLLEIASEIISLMIRGTKEEKSA